LNRTAHNSPPASAPAPARVGAETAELLGLLDGFRRRGRRVALAAGLGWLAAATVLVSILLIAFLGLFGEGWPRVLGIALASVAVIALSLAAVWLPLRRLAGLEAAARSIGRAHPALSSDVLTASQLALRPDRAERFSPTLVAGHAGQTAERLRTVAPAAVFPARRVLGAFAVAALAGASAIAAALAAPGVMASGLHALAADPGLPIEPTRTVIVPDPVVGDLSVVLRYPDYLERPERRLDTASGGLLAPIGTTVLLEGRSLVDGAESGEIALAGGRIEPLAVFESGMVRGRFVVNGGGDFFLRLKRSDRLMQGPPRRLEVEPDLPPTARLITPTGDYEVDEHGSIPLEFEAEDDHAISRVDLVVRGSGTDLRRTIVWAGDGVRRMRQRHRFDLQSIRLADPGSLELELEVFDGDTIRGPKPGKTGTLKVRVMTRLGRHLSAVEEQSRVLDGLVDLLALRLESPPAANREEIAARERFVAVRLATEDLLGRTARLIHALGRDPLTPRRIIDTFVQVREDLSKQLLHEARHHREPIESAAVRVDDLLLDQQLGRVVLSGDQLARGRAELLDLLQAYDGSRSEPARRAVLEAVERLAQAIDRLQQELEQVRGTVGEAYLNPGGVQRIDLGGALSRIRALVAEGETAAAARLAAEMELDIARLLAALESGLLSFRTERFGEGEKFVGELLDRLLEIETEQIQVRRQTTALQRRYQVRLMEVMRGRIDPLVNRELSRVGRIRQLLGSAESLVGESGREWLVAARVLIRELELALQQGDLEEARGAAEQIADGVDDLPPEITRPLAPVRDEARRVATEVEQAYARPAQLFGQQDRRQVKAQAVNQRLVSFRTHKLRGWIRGQEEETHFLSSRALSALEQVAARMEQGVEHLEAKRLRDALDVQSLALDELARLREDLRRGGSAAPIETRPLVLRAEVEIPVPGDYQVPPEFREDILEAMRDDLPASYREAIERYYETLVR
jgi:hypothetical protein